MHDVSSGVLLFYFCVVWADSESELTSKPLVAVIIWFALKQQQ